MKNVQVLSHSNEPFETRESAGIALGKVIKPHFRGDVVVVGIPEGGVVVAREIARIIDCPLDVVIARKMGAPYDPEIAVGAVHESGDVIVDTVRAQELRATDYYINQESVQQSAIVEDYRKRYRAVREKEQLARRTVIVVDDGLSDIAEMEAVLLAVRNEKPQYIVAALPLAPEEILGTLASLADQVICLRSPSAPLHVGEYYKRFQAVRVEDVIRLLNEEAHERSSHRR